MNRTLQKQIFASLPAFVLTLLLILSPISLLSSCNFRQNTPTDTTDGEADSFGTPAEGYTAESDPDADADLRVNPVFSVQGGVFTEALTLTVSLPENAPAGTRIHYTTDGSIPTEKSAELSEQTSLTLLDKEDTAVIRAVCVDSDGQPLGVAVTNTYLLSDALASPLYRISITCPQSDLNRIIQNYNSSEEVIAHIEMVTPSGERVISQDGGLRIFGGTSRSLGQKSFKIIARKTARMDSVYYDGTGSFRYPFFENRIVRSGEDAGKVLDRYDSLILRNGGNDSLQHNSVDPLRPTLLRDGLANNFAASVCETLDYANSTFCVVYLNGAYYGILDMRENMNEDYVRRVYGVDDQNVELIKSEVDTSRGGRFDGNWFYYESDSESALNDWKALCKKVTRAVHAKGDKYQSVFAEVEAAIDLESLKEYFALNLYLCNTDWPHNNVKLWRYNGEAVEGIAVTDGKWRFMTRDMDLGMGRYESMPLPEIYTLADTDTFYRTLGNYVNGFTDNGQLYPDSLGLQAIFAFVLRNDDFRAAFTDYCRELASEKNTAVLTALYKQSVSQIQGEIAAHIKRWKSSLGGFTRKKWATSHGEIAEFIRTRAPYFLEDLDTAMALVAS